MLWGMAPNAFCSETCVGDSIAAQEDSVVRESYFKPTQLIAPAVLISVGTAGVYWDDFKKLNRKIRSGMTDLRGDRFIHADDYVQYVPVAAYVGLGFIPGMGRHSFKERLAVGATAYIAMTAIVNATKYSVREPRPDTGTRNSFPSGHTATAFTGAELCRIEYGWPTGLGAYAVATGVAFLRLYNNRHWFNDVLAGAGIGILSANIGYWMLPLYQKWFKWDKKAAATVVAAVPAYDVTDRALSFNIVCSF